LERFAEGAEVVSRDREIFGKSSVQLESHPPQILTDVLSSREAFRTIVAGDIGVHDPEIACGDTAHSLADLDDLPGDLMPEHVGEGDDGRRDLALDDLDIRVAEAAGSHLEQNLSRPRLRPASLYRFQRLVVSFEEPCFHGVTFL
jgi:hypothetical protein